ncbi:UEV domain-containing protein [Cristinia sonorae]|uniref:UEV domain-containing protein n=1 Tax=Cristinia sonorae TaxID=1940300 RepID=A0A8K0UNM8_9AGAR|nr:UEV domain-containing protein [Cristinia sonorae]
MAESLTNKWLRQNIHLYTNKDTVFAHVDAALSRFTTIRPKTDIYTYDDGRTQLLLCLHGLLPITYRGTPYHIPIDVWITREYPRIPPIAYVVPTSDMLVRAGKFMEVSGRCQMDYLRNWERKSEGCSLSALLETMQDHFSREPPVYAKPKPATPSSSSPAQPRRPDGASPSYSERPPPPLPGAQPPPLPANGARNDDRPPVPLKPGASVVTTPAASPSLQNGRGPSPNISNVANPPLRPPVIPTNTGPPQPPIPPRYDGTSREASGFSSPPGWSPDLRMRPPPAPPASPPPTSPVHVPLHQPLPPNHYTSPAHQMVQPAPRPPPPPPPPPAAYSQAQSPTHSPAQYQQTVYSAPLPPPIPPQSTSTQSFYPVQGTFHPQVSPPPPPVPPSNPPPDLLSDDESASTSASPAPVAPAVAPPRPPNPELLRLHHQVHAKLTSELASLSQAMSLDAERLRANQADLLSGEPAIRDEMARLEAVRDVCQNVAGRLRTVVEAAERNVNELKRKGDPEVDELVCSTSIVHNQLINLVAEDNAIEDTMYHLHRALNAGRIDLERFLKTTRVLAEEQFMKRALIEKILAGIPMGSEWH